ncbi:YfiT family bacillithiol transferase [Catalinimonas sp. 4WD22]|uniref:YfiT family bacillithiol transferase n=1 Tax=Catalinimonas locisalis TaxID=3133978 RepID=UPI0031010F31
MKELQYPIGKFKMPATVSTKLKEAWILDLHTFPAQLRELLEPLNQSALLSGYRPGGWRITQIVHHCADSHMNAFIRCKLALTEDKPVIKDYQETDWAELPDATLPAPEVSLQLLTALHQRWVVLFENLSEAQFQRTYFHPGHQREFSLLEVLGLYSWHSRHHLSHIRLAIEQPV